MKSKWIALSTLVIGMSVAECKKEMPVPATASNTVKTENAPITGGGKLIVSKVIYHLVYGGPAGQVGYHCPSCGPTCDCCKISPAGADPGNSGVGNKDQQGADFIAALQSGDVSAYFNGNEWHSVIPWLNQIENTALLADLQSGKFQIVSNKNALGETFYSAIPKGKIMHPADLSNVVFTFNLVP